MYIKMNGGHTSFPYIIRILFLLLFAQQNENPKMKITSKKTRGVNIHLLVVFKFKTTDIN